MKRFRLGVAIAGMALAPLFAVSVQATEAVASQVSAAPPPRVTQEHDCYVERSDLTDRYLGQILCEYKLPDGHAAALPSAQANFLIQYVSTDLYGRKVAVTGTIARPLYASNPVPIISWAHGTTGVAHHCAPSLNSDTYPEKLYVSLMRDTLDRWVQQGYAVAQTDYEGLGIEPRNSKEFRLHPYLIGEAEARNVVDIVRATRVKFQQLVGKDWLVMGHSQGGQATVYTAELAKEYAPELNLVGGVAIAPAAYLSQQTAFAVANPGLPVSAFGALMMKGVEVVDPAVDISPLLTELGGQRYELLSTRCVSGLREEDGWSGPLRDLVDINADFDPLIAGMARYQDTQDRAPNVPLFIVQADNDAATLPVFTDAMFRKFLGEQRAVEMLCVRGLKDTEEYTVHQLTVRESFGDVLNWVSNHLPSAIPFEAKSGASGKKSSSEQCRETHRVPQPTAS